jgi:hypothetical protein
MQETPRNYTSPSYTKNDLRAYTKARWKDDVENDIRKVWAVNWRPVAQG